MSRMRSVVLASGLALVSCSGENADSPGDPSGPAGGKADDIRACESDSNCLQFRSYEVLFTNPLCNTYAYEEPIDEVDGEATIATKPKNVYCSSTHDRELAGNRDSSPQTRVLEWIGDLEDGDEIFLAYLSFSDQKVADALCEALGTKDVEVNFILDKMSPRAEEVKNCGGFVETRGHVGSVGFAHNKIIMINPNGAGPSDADDKLMRMSFGSGNMSSGTHLHHENWHFIEVDRESFFVESHLCLMESLLDRDHTQGKTAYKTFMAQCRATITHEPEDDMKPFFIPVRDDAKALTAEMVEMIGLAETIDIGAHRFSYNDLIEALEARLEDAAKPFHLRLVADDDLYWLSPVAPSKIRVLGPNTFNDSEKVEDLRAADGDRGRFEERYLETNHAHHLLHHNKFLILNGMDGRGDTLIVGSSNFTGTGFNDNLENMYITDIPEVVDAFKAQFDLFWDGEGPLPEGHSVPPLATPREDQPIEILTITDPADPGRDPDPDPDRECGLRIAEVLYDAVGSDNGREWIKLYNSCDDAKSLDGVSFGWGGRDYQVGTADLSGTVAGRSCLVVGGPTADSVDLALNFSPDLQNAGSTADGIALVSSGDIIDTVVYGGTNSSELPDREGMIRDPDVGDASSGKSLLLTAPGSWEISDTPSPNDCPDF